MAESIIKRYYEELGKGKLIATKCKKCSGYTFPPTTACQHCGSTDLEWVELSGRGKLLYLTNSMAPPPNPRFEEFAPFAYGHIMLEEHIPVQAIVTGVDVDPKNLEEIFNKGPIDVVPDIQEIKGLNVLAFKIK
jgi:hypothetical protein